MASIDPLTTKLDAVNYGLNAVSLNPVASIENTNNRAALKIRDLIDQESRTLQAEGWSWNTVYAQTFSPNTDGRIEMPANIYKIDTPDRTVPGATIYCTNYRLTFRKEITNGPLYLFNADLGTFEFDAPVTLKVTTFLEFDSLPQAARDLVAAKAAELYNSASLNDRLIDSVQQRKIANARTILEHSEDDFEGGHNLLDRNPEVQGKVSIHRRRRRYRR